MKQDILFLNHNDILEMNIHMNEILEAVESVLKEHGRGQVEMPPKPGIHPKQNAFIHAMPAYVPALNSSGIKWVSGFPDNHTLHLPQIMGLLILNDTESGRPLSIMDARWITAVRTAAVTGITAKYCARTDSKTIGLIGAGNQGKFNVLFLNEILPNLKAVKVFDIQEKAIEGFTEFIRENTDLLIIPVKEPEEAVRNSDVVITAAERVERPFIEYTWLKNGVFAVGLESGKAWGPAVVKMNKFITDDWEQTKYFASQGSFPGGLPNTYTEIGKIIIGEGTGRVSEEENIIACNVGLAIEDIAVGKAVYEKALEKESGTWLSMD